MAIVPLYGGVERFTVKAEHDIAEGILVRLTGVTDTQLKGDVATATSGVNGIASTAATAGELSSVVALVSGTVMKVQAASGVTAGTYVKSDGNGKVTAATLPSVNNAATDDGFLIVGRALTATTNGFCLVAVK